MCEQMSIFNAQGYVHLKDFLDKGSCAELTNELKTLVRHGSTRKDEQCPKSDAVHGAAVFDSLLEQLLPNFELASGKKLLPTYAYARLYAPGEVLKVHTDRPACEISATITLGFEGNVWPIFMGDYAQDGQGVSYLTESGDARDVCNIAKVDMQVGDAVLYRGIDKVHWREEYTEGKWQAQVFLHYVDANGPHKDEKYDRRKQLAHHKPQGNCAHFWHFADAFAPDACKKIIDSVEAQTEGEAASVGSGDAIELNKKIRDVRRVQLPFYRGIGATLAGMGLVANAEAWEFDVKKANQTEYLRYDIEGHYLPHVDTFINKNEPECRKLTILAFLNDDFEGGKFFMMNGHERVYPPQNVGTVLVFPSFILHGVEPVTKGVRRSVVTWLVGPWFK